MKQEKLTQEANKILSYIVEKLIIKGMQILLIAGGAITVINEAMRRLSLNKLTALTLIAVCASVVSIEILVRKKL